jgi:hypothetical protein
LPICFASVTFPAPIALPTKDAQVTPIPRGTMNTMELICRMMAWAATCGVPRKVARSIKHSKAHHSEHNMIVPGRPSTMNSFHSCSARQSRG